jgi:DNA (cytosine-5)-methyltransferase 1
VESLRAVSLFSNCGAGDVGYRRAGFQFDILAEKEPHRLRVALQNHPGARGIQGDIRKTWPRVVRHYLEVSAGERPALLAACPPCQGMSSAKGRRGDMEDADAGTADARNLLVLPIAEVAWHLKPRSIVVENVPVFLERKVRHPRTSLPISAARLLIELLAPEYVVFPLTGDLSHWGVPQSRKRAFLTFIHRDEKGLKGLVAGGFAPYPQPTHDPSTGTGTPITLRQALETAGLPALDAGSLETAVSDVHPLHRVPVWTDRRYAMVEAIPEESGATAWENDTCPVCAHVENDRSVARCGACGGLLLRPVHEADGEWRLVKGFRTSSYKRMAPDAPSPTITTASGHLGSHSTIHPSAVRVLSPLECSLLQTFPADFDWGDAVEACGLTHVRAMIGEAVPPRFTWLHGLALRGALTGRWLIEPISRGNLRVAQARRRILRTAKTSRSKQPRAIQPQAAADKAQDGCVSLSST